MIIKSNKYLHWHDVTKGCLRGKPAVLSICMKE